MGITENILGVLMLIFLNAYFDAFKIQRGWKIRHGLEGLIQFTVCVGLGWVCSVGVWKQTFLSLLNLSIFWLGFDYLLNRIRGKAWWYLGSNLIDRFMKGFELRFFRLSFKLTLVLIFTLIYLL